MSVSPVTLFHAAAPNPEADVYTVPSGLTVVVRRIHVANPTGGAQTISVSINGERVLGGKNVPANDFLPVELAYPIGTGAAIRALSSAAGTLILLVTGFSYT